MSRLEDEFSRLRGKLGSLAVGDVLKIERTHPVSKKKSERQAQEPLHRLAMKEVLEHVGNDFDPRPFPTAASDCATP